MAVKRNYNILKGSEPIGTVSVNGAELNVYSTRDHYRWYSQIQKLTGTGGALEDSEIQVVINAKNIDNLYSLLSVLRDEFSEHEDKKTAHGSNGEIVGFNDYATTSKFGLVKKARDPGNSTSTTVNQLRNDFNELMNNLRDAEVI